MKRQYPDYSKITLKPVKTTVDNEVLKVGDLVRVKSDHPAGYCENISCIFLNNDMVKLKGKSGKIIKEKNSKHFKIEQGDSFDHSRCMLRKIDQREQ